MRACGPTRGPRTRVETREVRVRPPSRSLSVARIDRAEAVAIVGPTRIAISREASAPERSFPRRASRGSARGPARALPRSRARVVPPRASVVVPRSLETLTRPPSPFPPRVQPGGGSRFFASSTDRTAAACARADWSRPWTRVAANRVDIHPSASTRMTMSPSRPAPPPRAASCTSPPRWAARSVARGARRARALWSIAAARTRRTPRTAAASPATAVRAATATRATPVPPTRRDTTSATRTASSTLARAVPSSRRLDRTPACIDPTRADRPSAPPAGAARSTTPWVSAAVSNSPATPSCVASSR